MNHQQAARHLFDDTFLLGPFRRRSALKWLMTQADAEAVGLLIEAVSRKHPNARSMQRFFSTVSSAEAVGVLVRIWGEKHAEWLGPIAVERALATGKGDDLPLDRETAWLVVAHRRGPLASQVEAYMQRVLAAQPEFVVPFASKVGRAAELERTRGVTTQALALLVDRDDAVRAGAETYLRDCLPHREEFNDLLVDEWIRTQSPFLAHLVAEPRLPSSPAKEMLIRLVNRDLDGCRRLQATDGGLLAWMAPFAEAASCRVRCKRRISCVKQALAPGKEKQLCPFCPCSMVS